MRTFKERVRGIAQCFPFSRMPRTMVRRLVEVATRRLNLFPAQKGMSDAHSPLIALTSTPQPNAKANSLDFGACAEVFEDNDWFQNSNRARTKPAIDLGP